jgi:hypothetical protein
MRRLQLEPHDSPDCLVAISQGNARYLKGDADCESDYRAAFLFDARCAAREIVGRLEADIRDDLGYVLVSCRKRLKINPQDVFARTRIGLVLLMLRQEEDAFRELQQVFLESPAWRPFLRLLVNRAKERRDTIFARRRRSL